MNPPNPSSDAPEAVSPGVQRRALGLLVLLVALVVGSAAYLMYARGLFEASHRLVLLADDAEGVTVGMDMSFAGFPIGRVQRIELGADGLARIVVNVPRKDANWLRTSSVFTLERSLVGSTKLRAYSGILSDPALPDGAERSLLKGDALAELPQLMDAVRTLLGNLNQLSAPDAALAQTLGNVAATTAKLQGPRGALGLLMGNEAEATRLLTQVQTTLASTQALLTRLDGVAQRTDGLLANANTQVFGPQGLAAGFNTTAGASAAGFGYQSSASGFASLAAGFQAAAGGGESVALGSNVRTGAGGSVVLGTNAWAQTEATGTFLFGDRSTASDLLGTAVNQFRVRAAGGTFFYSNAAMTSGVVLISGGGGWSNLSDVNMKTDFRDLDGEQVLAKLAALPIREWRYTTQDPAIRHAGPTAQDFRAAFGLGESDVRIGTVDADGIALAAVKALEVRTREMNATLTRENDELRESLAELRRQIAALKRTR